MTRELADLARRLEQAENALADAQARLPWLVRELREVRLALAEVARESRA